MIDKMEESLEDKRVLRIKNHHEKLFNKPATGFSQHRSQAYRKKQPKKLFDYL